MERHEADEARWARLRRPRHWTSADARWVMAALAASGKPMSVFAADRGVDYERLRRWRSRLAAASHAPVRPTAPEVARRAPPPPASTGQASLVPVSVRASAPVVVAERGAVVVSAGMVQIAIRDTGATSPDWVARLVGRLAAEGAS
jgi:hypothetical protein